MLDPVAREVALSLSLNSRDVGPETVEFFSMSECSCLSLEDGGGRHYHQNVRETYLHLSIFYK